MFLIGKKSITLDEIKYLQQSGEKIGLHKNAIAEIEKSIAPTGTDISTDAVEPVGTPIGDGSSIDNLLPTNIGDVINPDDLKSLVKQELSAIDA